MMNDDKNRQVHAEDFERREDYVVQRMEELYERFPYMARLESDRGGDMFHPDGDCIFESNEYGSRDLAELSGLAMSMVATLTLAKELLGIHKAAKADAPEYSGEGKRKQQTVADWLGIERDEDGKIIPPNKPKSEGE